MKKQDCHLQIFKELPRDSTTIPEGIKQNPWMGDEEDFCLLQGRFRLSRDDDRSIRRK